MIATHPHDWERRLDCLADLEWSRGNAELWEGRALVGGRITKGQHNVVLIANVIKNAMGLALDSEEKRIEERYGKSRNLQREAIQ